MLKKLLVVVALVLSLSIICHAELPNIETTVFYDGSIRAGITSKLISIGDVDLRIGAIDNGAGIISLGFELKKLEKLGSNVDYAWKGFADLDLGLYVGYNPDTQEKKIGFLAVLVAINIGGDD